MLRELVSALVANASPAAIAVAMIAVLIVVGIMLLSPGKKGANPFASVSARPSSPPEYVADGKKRDAVIKQRMQASMENVPKNLDAIVIGSGLGGLSAANLLARAGKRVLVLEQHDVAGGCTHMFEEKGYEFDTGVHYIGEMTHGHSLARFLFDTLTDHGLVWESLDEQYDEVIIGHPHHTKGMRRIPIVAGPDKFAAALKKEFPREEAAIDKYMKLLKKCRRETLGFVELKVMPSWLAQFLVKTGLVHKRTDFFKLSQQSLSQVLEELTEDEDLRATLAYSFGDYGTFPKNTPFTMHAMLINHFMYGGAYPRGGSSEFAFHMIPAIERAGGKVLVAAPVEEIMVDGSGNACGVTVGKHKQKIYAPIVISDAGVFNTYDKLLSEEVKSQHPQLSKTLSKVDHGLGGMTVFIGLKATAQDLKLPRRNFWVFRSGAKLDQAGDEFLQQDPQSFAADSESDVPLYFLSFPSTKDSTWDQRFPGRSTCEIVTLAPYEWFEQWADKRVMKRGKDYDEFKMEFAKRLWKHVLELFPQLEDKVEYMDIGTPVTNNYYIASPRGEIYGVDHNLSRFSPASAASLRPKTPIPGLYLTGQDVFTCGIVGSTFGGMLCASSILNRNLMQDMIKARNAHKKAEKSK